MLIRSGTEEIAGSHTKSVAHEIREAQHNHNCRRESRTGNAGDDRKGCHRAIDCTVNEVSQVAVLEGRREPLAYLIRMVTVAQWLVSIGHGHRSFPNR